VALGEPAERHQGMNTILKHGGLIGCIVCDINKDGPACRVQAQHYPLFVPWIEGIRHRTYSATKKGFHSRLAFPYLVWGQVLDSWCLLYGNEASKA
jgi:hypothetical protein